MENHHATRSDRFVSEVTERAASRLPRRRATISPSFALRCSRRAVTLMAWADVSVVRDPDGNLNG
jgi:hypothetical protein